MSPHDLNIKETLDQIDFLLHSAVKRRFVPVADFDDLRQDAFIAVFTGTRWYDARRASWPTFLATLIQSEINRFRLKKRWQKHAACESIHDLEEEDHPLMNNYPMSELNDIERGVVLSEMRQTLCELPDELQTICRMLLLLSKNDVAEMLEINARLLSQKITRIRKWLARSKIVQDYL